MADTMHTAQYFKVKVPNKPGVCSKVLDSLRKARVNLVAFSGFPRSPRAQLDFIPSNPAAFMVAAKKAKLKIVGPKTCFVVKGKDRPGAVADLVTRLAAKKINITALDAVYAGTGRYGALLWGKEKDEKKSHQGVTE